MCVGVSACVRRCGCVCVSVCVCVRACVHSTLRAEVPQQKVILRAVGHKLVPIYGNTAAIYLQQQRVVAACARSGAEPFVLSTSNGAHTHTHTRTRTQTRTHKHTRTCVHVSVSVRAGMCIQRCRRMHVYINEDSIYTYSSRSRTESMSNGTFGHARYSGSSLRTRVG